MFSDGSEAAERRHETAAQLHLCQAHHACGHVRPVRGACEERARLALFRDRCQPRAEHHRAGLVDEAVAGHRCVVYPRQEPWMTRLKAVFVVIAMLSPWTILSPLRAEDTSAKAAESIQIPLTPLPFELSGYLRRPNGTGPFPGVVLIPACGRFGNSVDRTWGETLASWGYVALTLDIFTAHGMSDQTACRFSGARPELGEDAHRGLDLLAER